MYLDSLVKVPEANPGEEVYNCQQKDDRKTDGSRQTGHATE